MLASLPPAVILIVAAFALLVARGRLRDAIVLGAPVLAFIHVLTLPEGSHLTVSYLNQQLVLLRIDDISRLFGAIFSLMAFLGGLFALRQENVRELAAAFLYAGSALGVVFAGDLLTVFIYWELMAIGSTLVIWSAGKAAYGAGLRYAFVHFAGGVVLMCGIAWHAIDTGSLAFETIGLSSPATWAILIGFLVNAGAWPISAWVGDAYPEASYSGTVFLSAFTTKTAVYVLWRGFPGTEILIVIGLIMVFYGIIYALLENDMRRILAYSIVNQVGFMVTGIGIGTEMALNGAAAHAFAHILYKALLLMSAGAVLYETGKRKCTDLGGLFQSMPITTVCGIIGALSISAFPLTSGFISKSMINQAAADGHLAIVWFALMAASAGVFLHAGIKFPWFVFFQKDSGLRPPDPPWHMRLAMLIAAGFCVGLGIFPQPLYNLLPFAVDYLPYTAEHVIKMLQLLLFSGFAFFALLALMKRTLTISLDVDWLYRRLIPAAIEGAGHLMRPLAGAAGWTMSRLGERGRKAYDRIAGYHGALSRSSETGLAILFLTVALAVALMLSLTTPT